MKIIIVTVSLCAAMLLPGASGAAAADTSRVYVQFKPGQKNAATALLRQAGGQVHHEFDSLNAVATTVPIAALQGIQNNPNVVLVEEDPVRSLFASGPSDYYPYGLMAVQATDLWDANLNGALDSHAITGAGVKVGIIDSGVFSGHADFTGVAMTGYPADWNVDHNGHGTHVTGTIVAQLNGSGVVGASPGISIHMVKVFGDVGEWVYSSTLISAAQNCQAAGCRVISMSLGGGRPSRTEERGFAQLYSAGILLVASAGNGGTTSVNYPAGYASVISVAAVDETRMVADFSQKNADVELAAPGVGVLSTVPYLEENTATVDGATYSGYPIEFATRGTVSGVLVDGGLATAGNRAWNGKIVLVQRGQISFADKVLNVQKSGGVGCIIYNNVPGDFLGTLGENSKWCRIPAISVSQEKGLVLLTQLDLPTTLVSRVLYEQSAFAYYDGTSMSAPHVSAVAALVWSANLSSSNQDVRDALNASALDLGLAGRDPEYGYGLVQAKAALQLLGR